MEVDEFLASEATLIDPSLIDYADTVMVDGSTGPGGALASDPRSSQYRDAETISKFQVCTSCRR